MLSRLTAAMLLWREYTIKQLMAQRILDVICFFFLSNRNHWYDFAKFHKNKQIWECQ